MLSRCQTWLLKQRKKCKTFQWNCVQPERRASTEFSVIDHVIWESGTRSQSLPRRLIGNFMSERNMNDESEQIFLKQFLKEHGLYAKHQTIQQRRRVKELLELEQRTLHCTENNADASIVLHSFQPTNDDDGGRSVSPEVNHTSNPIPEQPTPRQANNEPGPVKRSASFPTIVAAGRYTVPNPGSVLPWKSKETRLRPIIRIKPASWRTSSTGLVQAYLETAV